MSDEAWRREYVLNWWQKAEESLNDARTLYNQGSLFACVSRLYYAAFYAVQAWLGGQGISYRKHSGVRSGFHQYLVRTGLLDSRWGEFYDQLFEDRTEADYNPSPTFDREYVGELLQKAEEFLSDLRPLIKYLDK